MDPHQYRFERECPSFSSTLLDVIYRSIDERQDIDSVNVERTSGNVARRKSATGFENSRNEAIYGFPSRNKPKPIRTCIREDNENECSVQVNEKLESKFVKTKSKAMKIYGYLKQGKHPISPGGRLTSFLASFFSNEEKAKKSTKSKISCTGSLDEVIIPPKSKSVSSFSRTCVNKATSSSFRKSVTFTTHECAESRGQRKKVECSTVDENDDDDMSCSSSDLFELDHLSAIGIDSCMQELPLYETTNVDVNRAIANGLLV